MFARMHTTQGTADQHDVGLELLRDEILPWLRDSTGFRGILRLTAADRSKTIVISLWADEASMQASAEAGRGLGALSAETTGSTYLGPEDYEVTFFDADLTRDELPS
jgi:heme-degrading monooxygenase HmoA